MASEIPTSKPTDTNMIGTASSISSKTKQNSFGKLIFDQYFDGAQSGAAVGAMTGSLAAFFQNRPFATTLVTHAGCGTWIGGILSTFTVAYTWRKWDKDSKVRETPYYIDTWAVGGSLLGMAAVLARSRNLGVVVPWIARHAGADRALHYTGGAALGSLVGSTLHIPVRFVSFLAELAQEDDAPAS